MKILLSDLLRDVRYAPSPRDDANWDRCLSAAVEWLFRSQDVTDCDGSSAAYNLVFGWQTAFPETTGYIIPTLYDVASAEAIPEAEERAGRMAEWLRTVQAPDGSFAGHPKLWGTPDPMVFDTGQIVFGLLRHYRETGDERFRDAVMDACEWLVSTQDDDGAWRTNTYNGRAHSYAVRVAWALAEAGVATGSPTYVDAAKKNLSWAVEMQRPNGWFERCGFDDDTRPFLHTIAYTVRGLLEGGLITGHDAAVTAARRTASTLGQLQADRGVLTGQYDTNWTGPDYHCLTGNAQMAVIWCRLAEEKPVKASLYREQAVETVNFLCSTLRLTGSPDVRGGLKGSQPVWQRYMYLRYPNWATKFLVDALLHVRKIG